jgi:hypothetical protein
VQVRRDLSVRVDAAARKYLDRLCEQFGFGGGSGAGEAELLRVLLVSSCLAGRPARDRAAAALYVNASKKFTEKAARLSWELQDDLSRYAADLAEASARVRVPHEDKGPAAGSDRPKIRVKIDGLLEGRLGHLVSLLDRMRCQKPVSADSPAERALVAYVQANPHVLTGRSMEAVVVRWGILVEPFRDVETTEQVINLYLRLWGRMFEVIDRSFVAARREAVAALREGEEHVRPGT